MRRDTYRAWAEPGPIGVPEPRFSDDSGETLVDAGFRAARRFRS